MRQPRVVRRNDRGARMVQALFSVYFEDLTELPDASAKQAREAECELGTAGRSRVVADYIAGMTDRYAEREYARLNGSDTDEEAPARRVIESAPGSH